MTVADAVAEGREILASDWAETESESNELCELRAYKIRNDARWEMIRDVSSSIVRDSGLMLEGTRLELACCSCMRMSALFVSASVMMSPSTVRSAAS